ncbi:hypothetical protein [Micavibrio aeruginosavorus]|uniref:hypothetical protein n=1 Tax=Micavibrio aeruginosavorus TaxID=349221 RepID=UPI003F4ACBA7
MQQKRKPSPEFGPESGNVIFFILLGIALVGLVTAALRSGGSESANIDAEQMVIKVSQVQQYASALARATEVAYQNVREESAISFAHPDSHSDYGTYGTTPSAEIFHVQGGGADYLEPPAGVNDTSAWEFYGTTAAPDVGTDAADLIAVLPNVTPEFCTAMNTSLGQLGDTDDTGTCVYDSSGVRFSGIFSSAPNTMDGSSFTFTPAPQGCVTCTGAGNTQHFYKVILAR